MKLYLLEYNDDLIEIPVPRALYLTEEDAKRAQKRLNTFDTCMGVYSWGYVQPIEVRCNMDDLIDAAMNEKHRAEGTA